MTQNKPEENKEQSIPVNDWETEVENAFNVHFKKDHHQNKLSVLKRIVRTQINLAYFRGKEEGYVYGDAAKIPEIIYKAEKLERKKVIEEIKEWAKKEMKANPLHNLFDLNDYLNNLEK